MPFDVVVEYFAGASALYLPSKRRAMSRKLHATAEPNTYARNESHPLHTQRVHPKLRFKNEITPSIPARKLRSKRYSTMSRTLSVIGSPRPLLKATSRTPSFSDGPNFPRLRNLPDLGHLEFRVPTGEPAGQQLGHHRLLHDLELIDDRLSGLDGLVHGGEDGSDLPLLAQRRNIELAN